MCNLQSDVSRSDSFISSILRGLSGGEENNQREQQQRSIEYVFIFNSKIFIF
jgi:hypothetical protein